MTDPTEPEGSVTPPEPARPVIEPGLLEAAGAVPVPEPQVVESPEAAAALPERESRPDPEPEPLDEDVAAIPLAVRVEALLFAAGEAISMARLRDLAGCSDAAALRREVDALQEHYDATGRAFSLEEVAGGLQLRSRPDMAPVLARLGRRPGTSKLTPASVETLAIVAYRQPVLRADIEKIRGVAGGEVLRGLVDRGFVRVAGRADLPGNPLLYGTTRLFLEAFGLRDLRDLPSDPKLLERPSSS